VAASGIMLQVQALDQQSLVNVTMALNDMTAQPKPNYSINGQSYSWAELFDKLQEMKRKLLVDIQDDDGPWEVVNYGRF